MSSGVCIGARNQLVWQAHGMSELPPLDQPLAYVVVGPNDQRGPYTMDLLISEVLAGRLSDETPVWWPGLADWTTIAGHPAVAAELTRRRAPAAAAPDPAWGAQATSPAPPAPASVQSSAPVADPVVSAAASSAAAAPVVESTVAPAAADPFSPAVTNQSDQVVQDPFGSQATFPAPDDPVDAKAFVPESSEAGASAAGAPLGSSVESPVPADVIDVEEIVVVDGQHHQVFAALVARSAVRAEIQSRVDSVNAAMVDGIVTGVTSQGFELSEKVDTDRGAELRFDATEGDLVVVSLGRAVAARPEDLRDDHVPVTASFRSGARDVAVDDGTGDHGEVTVVADEWTGESTSTVSLFLPLGDYLGADLSVATDALARDAAATIAVLRSRLA